MGHSAILLSYPGGEQRVFDYGVVFASPATTRNLITGTIVAYQTMSDARSQLPAWAESGRSVAIQRLDLSDEQRTKLIKRLFADHDDRRGYRYEFQTNNCTTRIRDLLDDVTDGALRRAGSASTGLTPREIGAREIRHSWVIAAFDVVLNDAADRPASRWEAALFPAELSRLVASTTVTAADGALHPLQLSESVFAAQVPVADPLAHSRIAFLLAGALVAVVALLLGYAVRRGGRVARGVFGLWVAIVGGALGFSGAVLGSAWLFTDYRFAWYNENLLVLNPLLLATVPLGLCYAFGGVRATRALSLLLMFCAFGSLLALGLKATPAFNQDNWRTVLLALPALVGLAGGLWVADRRPIPMATGWTRNPVVAGAFHDRMSAHFAPTHSSGWSRIP